MNKQIRILPLARQDMRSAKLYYDGKKAGLGHSLVAEIENKLLVIASNSEIGQNVERNVRRILIKKFPFGIYYASTIEIVFVVAFLHLSMSPTTILERLNT